jgi:hypothetical protein
MSMETARRAIDLWRRMRWPRGYGGSNWIFTAPASPRFIGSCYKRRIYARGVARSRGLELRSSLTTNGVLPAGKRAWIVAHLNSANVSFDGLPEVQDANRRFPSGRGSSDLVLATLRDFDRRGFRYSIRMTVTAESAPRLAQSVAFLCRRFQPRAIQVEPLYRMGRGRDAVNAETEVFIEAYRAARRTSGKAAERCASPALASPPDQPLLRRGQRQFLRARLGNLWVTWGSAPGLSEEAVELAAGGVEGALLVFPAVVDQRAAVLVDHVADKLLRGNLPQTRALRSRRE